MTASTWSPRALPSVLAQLEVSKGDNLYYQAYHFMA